MSQVGFLVWPALAWNCKQYFRFSRELPGEFYSAVAHDCLSDQVELLFQQNCVDRLFLFLSLVANALGTSQRVRTSAATWPESCRALRAFVFQAHCHNDV
jgi:hypothetical protein